MFYFCVDWLLDIGFDKFAVWWHWSYRDNTRGAFACQVIDFDVFMFKFELFRLWLILWSASFRGMLFTSFRLFRLFFSWGCLLIIIRIIHRCFTIPSVNLLFIIFICCLKLLLFLNFHLLGFTRFSLQYHFSFK